MRILILIPFLFTSCGTAPVDCTDHPLLGSWRDDETGDTLTFRNDCTGAGDACGEAFNFSDPNAGGVALTVQRTNGHPACLEPGRHECTFKSYPPGDGFTSHDLALSCDGGDAAVYQLIK